MKTCEVGNKTLNVVSWPLRGTVESVPLVKGIPSSSGNSFDCSPHTHETIENY